MGPAHPLSPRPADRDAPAGRGLPDVPDQRTLLIGIFALRGILCLTLLARAGFLWTERPEVAFIAAVGVLLTLLLSAPGVYRYVIRREPAGSLVLFAHSFLDLALVTGLVHLGGPIASELASLYILVIAGYAVALPFWYGLGVAALAVGAYLGDTLVLLSQPAHPGLLGQILIFAFVFVLVTALSRRLRETALRHSRLERELARVRLEAGEILSNIRAGVLTVDGDGRLAFVNPPAARLLELDEGWLGAPVLDRLRAVAPELHDAIVSGIRHGLRVGRGEGTVRLLDGTVLPIGLSTATFERAAGGETAVTAIFTDLSELKELQDLQRRAERLEAVASLSAALAHEIRNPLASIRSSVEQLAAATGADDDSRVLSRLIMRESDRLNRLLGEFLDFSRVRTATLGDVDLRASAQATLDLIREHPDCGPGVSLRLDGPATPLLADEDLLHRILSNLVLNAVQACGGTGEVRVRVGPADPDEVPGGVSIPAPVRLVVEDTGPGIDPDLRERLFQPFVSGRPGGSGLGLAIVQRAVDAHRGMVLLDAEPGRGARFTVYLPSRPYREDQA